MTATSWMHDCPQWLRRRAGRDTGPVRSRYAGTVVLRVRDGSPPAEAKLVTCTVKDPRDQGAGAVPSTTTRPTATTPARTTPSKRRHGSAELRRRPPSTTTANELPSTTSALFPWDARWPTPRRIGSSFRWSSSSRTRYASSTRAGMVCADAGATAALEGEVPGVRNAREAVPAC